MEERLAKILEDRAISSTELANSLGIQRSNVSHVLTGRNKPSFSFIEKLLSIYPDISADWLIMGSGSMYKASNAATPKDDLLNIADSQSVANNTSVELNSSKLNFNGTEIKQSLSATPEKQLSSPVESKSESIATGAVKKSIDNDTPNSMFLDKEKATNKEIDKIVIFYKDNTFDLYQ
ncbi:MAG: helix-turn-helix domain-containing protein [Bacteroidales bacterium]